MKCNTCSGQPLWVCQALDTCGKEPCFITCPECGQTGFNRRKPEGFVQDLEWAQLVREEREAFKVTELQASLERGLADSAAGQVEYLGSFEQYADEDTSL